MKLYRIKVIEPIQKPHGQTVRCFLVHAKSKEDAWATLKSSDVPGTQGEVHSTEETRDVIQLYVTVYGKKDLAKLRGGLV